MTDESRGRTALVTGASSGIGRSFAVAYARRGVNILGVARRPEPLRKLAEELRARFGISFTTVAADLADPKTPNQLYDHFAAKDRHVDILVNCAGFGVPGELCDVAWSRHRSCIEAMATAPVHLCHLFAPLMAARGHGRIVNVSSLSALLPPHAGGTLYYPVKSFLLQFSLAFGAEMKAEGVNVTALCPGFTVTNFQAAAGGTVESVAVPRWLWSDPDAVAEAGIRAITIGRPVEIPGVFNKTVAVACKLLPARMGRWIVA